MAGIQKSFQHEYETVAASQTAQVLGGTGAAGDYLDSIIVTVNTAATATVTLLDGSLNYAIFPASPGGGIGVYPIPIRAASVGGPWKVTTGAGCTVLAIGDFSV